MPHLLRTLSIRPFASLVSLTRSRSRLPITKDCGKQAIVDLLTVVSNKNGKDVGHAAQTLEANLNQEQYRMVLHSGLQVAQSVSVSADAYHVRLGAIDRARQRVGMIEVTFDVK